MNHRVRNVTQWVLSTRCPYIAFCVVVGFEVAVDACGKSVSPDVKLSPAVQKWVVDVLLDYPCAAKGSIVSFLNDWLNLLKVFSNLNAIPTVCLFTRLYNPHVCIFSHVSIVVLSELFKSWLIHSVLNVECNWQRQVWVHPIAFVVFLQISE